MNGNKVKFSVTELLVQTLQIIVCVLCTVTGCGGCSINHTSPIRPISQDTSQYRGGNVLYKGPH